MISLFCSLVLGGFIEDDHQECCRIRKVRSLKRALKVLRAWITGQRKDQSAGTLSEIPIVQIDPSFEGLDGGACSLVKLNPVANVDGKDIWNFLRAMNVPVNSLHSQGYVTIGCEPCMRVVLPGQHEQEGSTSGNGNGAVHADGGAAVSDIFDTKDIASLGRPGIENLLKLEIEVSRGATFARQWKDPTLNWWRSWQMLLRKQQTSGQTVSRKLGSFPTILFFPRHSSRAIKYLLEKRDVNSLLAFVNALRGYVSIGCDPCTRAIQPDIVSLSRPGIENLLRLENRREPWLLVLYAPWCRFCQAMEGSYVELAEKLASYGVKVAKNKDRW
ncbi:hypothetical protein P3S68_003254 [Capsicum galapagoense]